MELSSRLCACSLVRMSGTPSVQCGPTDDACDPETGHQRLKSKSAHQVLAMVIGGGVQFICADVGVECLLVLSGRQHIKA
ncbi:hypothetical protein FIBSPDRAFT_857683 [Athelia psychrophila]|uniref:Uncharacterized protein n=1 Tax=Athelia psychrophila TaxID=1759441 RepID=A0A166MEM8_9AGAM|nr:hypothetical protein FIBSPDRAFT_857683 [Fibularhizoctonia sp. CBS 109695]